MSTTVSRRYSPILKKDILITYVTESQVLESKWCNTNNHKFNEFTTEIKENEGKEISKLEYHAEMCFTDYDRFVDNVSVKDKNNNPIIKIYLKPNECEELFDIAKIATISGRIPLSKKDDFYFVLYSVLMREFSDLLLIHKKDKIKEYLQLNDNADYSDIPLKYYDINKKYFIRLNECSPKDSELGMGPFTNIKQMFQSLITSMRACKALQKAYFTGFNDNNFGNGTYLFMVPWRDDIKSKNEFRCFIKDNKLKAVSQYVWYRDYQWINKQNILFQMCHDIQLLANKISKVIKHNNYVLDIHVLFNNDNDNDKGYLIEMIECNSFGAQMASGSGCYHWIRDYNQLYGIKQCINQIEVRVVVKDDNIFINNNNKNPRSQIIDLIDELLRVFE